ncbi:2TM domain-containing protein, partial [Klebsiella michiganensis]
LPLADGDGPVARARRFAPLPGKARVERESHFYRSLTVAVVVCVLLALLNWLSGAESYWSAWVAIVWGALLAVKGLRLFVFGEWINRWRQARLQRLLRK